jgi:hypothetical protein
MLVAVWRQCRGTKRQIWCENMKRDFHTGTLTFTKKYVFNTTTTTTTTTTTLVASFFFDLCCLLFLFPSFNFFSVSLFFSVSGWLAQQCHVCLVARMYGVQMSVAASPNSLWCSSVILGECCYIPRKLPSQKLCRAYWSFRLYRG